MRTYDGGSRVSPLWVREAASRPGTEDLLDDYCRGFGRALKVSQASKTDLVPGHAARVLWRVGGITMEAHGQALRVREAASRLGCSEATVRQLFDTGRLRGQRTVLGRVLDAADVERLRAERLARAEGRRA